MKTRTYLIPLMTMELLVLSAQAQVRSADFASLRSEGEKEGWTFSVGKNEATERPLDELCGMTPPAGWEKQAKFVTPRKMSAGALPSSFDWRAQGLPPIRNQGNCGSCWAFATVGALESAIQLREGVTVDLSEQWLVSCNRDNWGCGGGWFAHGYHLRTGGSSDAYGGNGALLESDFPYTATDASCRGPYPHRYWIDGWAYLAGQNGIPSVSAIKQAIMTYGPISVGVYVSSAFQSYTSGVFNRNEDRTINHAVVLVGWDDSQGANGVWILRNSWGTGWGESGYMRIEYGCCRVGYAACFIDYRPTTGLQVTPAESALMRGPVGGPFTPQAQSYTLRNSSSTTLVWTASRSQSWLGVAPSSGTLAAGQSVEVVASLQASANSLLSGVYNDTITFTNRTAGVAVIRSVLLRCGQVDYLTELFDAGDNDLDNLSFTLTPNGSPGFYGVTCVPAEAFPSDPTGGTSVSLPDDGYAALNLGSGMRVSLFGISYAGLYVGANGYLTFGSGDSSYLESLDTHFNRPRISALYDDLNPAAGGSVSWRQFADRVAITWQNIKEYNASTVNNFQIECFTSGVIRLTYLGIAARDGLAGVSRGQGKPADYEESDYSAYPPPPVNNGAVRVDLSPVAAVAAGAQWRLDGGLWRASGETVEQVPAGSHVIDYKDTAGYVSPAAATVVVAGNETTTVNGVYTVIPVALGEALDYPSWTWVTDGDAPWVGQTAVSHDGTDAAQSGPLNDSGSSSMGTTIAGPGVLNFWWKVSSEQDWDKLSFTVDGAATSLYAISGELDWQQVSVSIPAGQHKLTWTYAKDEMASGGLDGGWVDQVTFTAASEANLALSSRGSTISGNNGADWKKMIDGSTAYSKRSGYGYTLWKKAKPVPGKVVLDLKSVCTISRIRLLLYSLDSRYHKYLIESSVDGTSWTLMVDRTRTNCRGWQELSLAAPVEARYLRLTGTYCSIGNYFMVPEWQVYGLVGRYAAVRTMGEAGLAGSVTKTAPKVVDVITSGGRSDYALGWRAVDHTALTAWNGAPQEGGCWLALVYDCPVAVNGVRVNFAEGSCTNVMFQGSMDATTWFDLGEAWERGPAKLQYLWLIFPQPDPTVPAPVVREIEIVR